VRRIVNLAGPVFVARMKEMSGASGAEVARAFTVAEGETVVSDEAGWPPSLSEKVTGVALGEQLRE